MIPQRKKGAYGVYCQRSKQSRRQDNYSAGLPHFSEDSRLDVEEVENVRAIIDDAALSACVGIQELKATIDKALDDGAL